MKRYLLLAFLFSFSTLAFAQKGSWHGYIAQGLSQSIDSGFITDNNAITGELTELGINGRYSLSPQLSVVGQIVYLDGGNRFVKGSRLDYLFLDWRLPSIGEWQPQVHIGRFKNTHWLFSATRDVPHTRVTAVLPQSVYFDAFRDIALSSDGVLAEFKRYTDNSIWQVIWSYGRSPISDEQTEIFLGPQALGDAKQDFVHQLSVYWQPADMSWRIGLSGLSSNFRYEPSANDFLSGGGADIRRLMFSAQYFAENWEFSSEILSEFQKDRGVFSPDYQNNRAGIGGYVQFRYMIRDDVSVLAGLDAYYLDRDDKDGSALFANTGGRVATHYAYSRAKTLAVRWDLAPNWRIQAEHHWVDGGARSKSFLNPLSNLHTAPHWRMWSAQLMYWF